MVGRGWIVIENELTELRRVNPVDVSATDQLVAGHRSAFAEVISQTQARAGDGRPLRSKPTTGPWARFRLVGSVAATLVALALPVLFLTMTTRNDDVDTPGGESPALDQLPQPDDVDAPAGLPAPREDELPPLATPESDPPPASTTAPTTTTTTVSTSTTTTTPAVEPPSDAAATPPVPPAHTETTTTAPPTTTAPSTASTAPATTVSPTTTDPEVGVGDEPIPVSDASQPFDPTVDLLVVTFDFANSDDGHASAATRELATNLDLEPLVIAGTPTLDATGIAQEYTELMSAVWGTDWLDAGIDRSGAVTQTADRWLMTIDGGGVVRVAEGGVSDFTAEVVREVQRRRPALDTTSAINVVHHNGRNEDETRPADLDAVRADTTYVRIDDGNSANDTADLTGASAAFESAALAGPHRDGWLVAFDHRPADSLDFSDTVTVLHIIGVGLDDVADVDTFTFNFMR